MQLMFKTNFFRPSNYYSLIFPLVVLVTVSIVMALLKQPIPPTTTIATSSNKAAASNPVLPPPKEVVAKVLFGGDVMLADLMGRNIENVGMDPFQFMRTTIFPQQDLIVINLECSLSDPKVGKPANKAYRLRAPLSALKFLQGITVSMANNHVMDFGASALNDNLARLDAAEINYFGAGRNLAEAFKPKVIEVKGTKIALLGFNDVENIYTDATNSSAGAAFMHKSKQHLVVDAIKSASAISDLVVVFPHWGIEHSTKSSSDQRFWGRLFVDAGADLVVGAGPHVVQEVETYAGKQIYYSLGNFVFTGQYNLPNAIRGNLLQLTVVEGKITNQELLPVKLTYNGPPELVN